MPPSPSPLPHGEREKKVEIIYENPDWLLFFERALQEINMPYRLAFIDELEFDPSTTPDDIVYLNRTSPSSHTRGHLRAVERGQAYLTYLAEYNRRVINDIRSIRYETSKRAQYDLLERHGLAYPKTRFGTDAASLLRGVDELRFPLLTKHNCSGKGLGIEMFSDVQSLHDSLRSDRFGPSPDGILLLQEYIRPKDERITRVEITDYEFVYAFQSSTVQGFELCPADACAIDRGGKSHAVCDVGSSLFTYIPDFEHPIVERYIALAREAGFDLVGIEFIEDDRGNIFTYDINGTTNYSPDVEMASGHKAKKAFQQLIIKR